MPHIHEVVDFLAGTSELQGRRASWEALSKAPVKHFRTVLLQEVPPQAINP